jgi:PST family polysaccharide transporter
MLLAIVYYGIPGVIAVRLATALIMAGWTMHVIRELIGLRLRDQLFGPWRATLSTLIMVAATFPLKERFTDMQGIAQLILDLTIVGAVGGTVYIASMYLLWRLVGSPDGIERHLTKLLAGAAQRIRRLRH